MANTPPSSDLFASLISDIKTYSGTDPLLPWLRGIRKLRDSLPAQLLNEKLPRFLQKCAQNFQSDRRYQNDLRYVRVWLQLMDFVDDPKALLRTMENNRIGMKKALFYQAYALYYEKNKKFEEAEKMYHLGVQNLAEPNGELQKSYEQFLHRLKRHKNKRVQCPERKTAKIPLFSRSTSHHASKSEENNENICLFEGRCTGIGHEGTVPENLSGVRNVSRKEREECPRIVKPLMESNRPSKDLCNADSSMKMEHISKVVDRSTAKKPMSNERGLDEHKMFRGDDTVVVKFVDTAVVGKSEAEDACHHGLVDPTINMKEAMDAINSMFREPIETAPVGRRSHRNQPKECNSSNNGFEVFIDEKLDKELESTDEKEAKGFPSVQGTNNCQPHQEPFQIFIDGEDSDENDNVGQNDVQNAFVLACPRDDSPESSDDQGVESSRPRLRREDTVVRRFVGSAIADAPEVENVCHHGLVEPTVNLKEAMDDINNMFGKPIDFVRSKRSRKQDAPPPPSKGDFGGFSILPDDDMEPQPNKPLPKKSNKSRENELFEPTVFTKEAMDDINKLFGMPLDF